jgi:general secretion pathway protein H
VDVNHSGHDGQNGLTLLEALVGLAILAALITISVPFLQSRPGANLDGAARQVAAQLRQAQSLAVRSAQPADVMIDVSEGRIGRDQLARTNPPITLSVLTAIEQRQSATSGSIRFFPDGGSTGGGVTLSQGGRRMHVLVDWLTGRVSTAEAR